MIALVKVLRNSSPAVKLSFVVLAFFCGLALLAPYILPYGETEIVGASYETWSSTFPLGTDALGRDILSRLAYGGRNTIGIAMLAAALAFIIGTVLGMVSALSGGWLDQMLGRLFDFLIAIPQLILALLVLAIVGTSVGTLIGVIGVVESTRIYRAGRAATMDIVVQDFVESARVRGESRGTIIFGEILPNVTAPLFTEFGVRFSACFLFISSLSFLGLGIQPPFADWGSMTREYAALLSFGLITPLIPACAIAAVAISVNVIVDWGLRLHSRGTP